jgi:hypothetical protein
MTVNHSSNDGLALLAFCFLIGSLWIGYCLLHVDIDVICKGELACVIEGGRE